MAGSYKTKQRDTILRYMTEHRDAHVTVNTISDYLSAQGTPVGTATIYRHLEKLVEQGIVRKYMIDAGTGACFQFAAPDQACQEHFHLKCERCGKLIHLKCEFIQNLEAHIYADHGFAIDPLRTVFYGVCRECRQNDAAATEDNASC